MRINPDGTGLTPTGENMRNLHDMFVTSQGDLLQSDNDDPAHARISWVMEGANMGRGGENLGGTGGMEQESSLLSFSLAGELSGGVSSWKHLRSRVTDRKRLR